MHAAKLMRLIGENKLSIEHCPFTIGQSVTVSHNNKYANDWSGRYIVIGLYWDYQKGIARINVSIASEEEILRGEGPTDGWRVEDLLAAS